MLASQESTRTIETSARVDQIEKAQILEDVLKIEIQEVVEMMIEEEKEEIHKGLEIGKNEAADLVETMVILKVVHQIGNLTVHAHNVGTMIEEEKEEGRKGLEIEKNAVADPVGMMVTLKVVHQTETLVVQEDAEMMIKVVKEKLSTTIGTNVRTIES